jgi:hypothetical protein
MVPNLGVLLGLLYHVNDLFLVRNPVLVPSVDSGRVMDAQNVNRLDFEVGMFELYSRIQLMSRSMVTDSALQHEQVHLPRS